MNNKKSERVRSQVVVSYNNISTWEASIYEWGILVISVKSDGKPQHSREA